MNKRLFWLERGIDWVLALTGFAAISLWLPTLWSVAVSVGFLLLFFVFVKKTPAMLLFKRDFLVRGSLRRCVKLFLGLDPKGTILKRSSFIRKSIGVIVGVVSAVFVLFAENVQEFDADFEDYQCSLGWNYYRSEDRGFAIQFPGNPVLETGELYVAEAGKAFYFNEYKSFEASGAYYTVSYIDFPSRWRFVGSGKLLSTALDLLLRSEEGIELVSHTSVQHRNWPAVDFQVKKGEEIRSGRLILIGNTFYKVMRVSSTAFSEDPHFEEFLQSFLFPKI